MKLRSLFFRFPFLLITAYFLFTGCRHPPDPEPATGTWRGSLQVSEGRELPFLMELRKEEGQFAMIIRNGEEVLEIDEVRLQGDSIYMQMPVFEEYIAGTYTGYRMQGYLFNESRGRKVPFEAAFGDRPRFPVDHPAQADIAGEWEVVFGPDTPGAYPAKGIFTQQGNVVRGTFRTTTGDRRYLEGVVTGDTLRLSTFDGTHAYLFVAGVSDSTMQGTYYSGNHFQQPFTGVRNPDFELPEADSLTFLRPGYDRLEFEFPDLEGNKIGPQAQAFRDRVLIVQLMGTWCPNCLDETRFLTRYLEANPGTDLKVLALAFEYAKTEEDAFSAIERLKRRTGIPYPVVLAQYGGANKLQANEKLPMLDRVLAYPTLIFIGRDGRVRKIHTGFDGPATGDKHEEFRRDFDAFVRELLAE